MTKAEKLLASMRRNPIGWRMADIISVCNAHGIACTSPSNGSHYKVKHPAMVDILTIPSHKPIKPVYVRDLVKFIDAVAGAS